jgi:hypothetical protein
VKGAANGRPVNVVTSDILVDRSIAHIIDGVLLPDTLVTLQQADKASSALPIAGPRAGLWMAAGLSVIAILTGSA